MEPPQLESIADLPLQKPECELTPENKKEKMLEERRRKERERTRLLRARETPEEARIRREKSALRARKNRALKKLKSQVSAFIENELEAQDVMHTSIKVEDIEHNFFREEKETILIDDLSAFDCQSQIMECEEKMENENVNINNYLDAWSNAQDALKERCPECSTVILRRSLYRHLKTVHKYSEDLVAEYKQKIHARNKNANINKSKYCISCQELFSNELQLQSHMKLMHVNKSIKKEPEINNNLIIPEKVNTSCTAMQDKPPKENYYSKFYPNGVIPTVPIEDAVLDMLNWSANVEV